MQAMECEKAEEGKAASPFQAPKKKQLKFIELCGKLCQGISKDFCGRKDYYVADWTEVSKDKGKACTRIIAAAVYIFFASALPAIAFGQQLTLDTGT
jgi:hypothetical protein